MKLKKLFSAGFSVHVKILILCLIYGFVKINVIYAYYRIDTMFSPPQEKRLENILNCCKIMLLILATSVPFLMKRSIKG